MPCLCRLIIYDVSVIESAEESGIVNTHLFAECTMTEVFYDLQFQWNGGVGGCNGSGNRDNSGNGGNRGNNGNGGNGGNGGNCSSCCGNYGILPVLVVKTLLLENWKCVGMLLLEVFLERMALS